MPISKIEPVTPLCLSQSFKGLSEKVTCYVYVCLVGEAASAVWWAWLPPCCELTKDRISV